MRDPAIPLSRLAGILADIREQYEREEDQGILQGDMEKARAALAGKEALARIKNTIGLREEMHDNMVQVLSARKRA